MRRVELRDFLDFSSLSALRLSPDGRRAAFVRSRCDYQENSYQSHIWVLDLATKEQKQLTWRGKETSFLWLDNETILFAGEKSGKLLAPSTTYYKVRVDGGEPVAAFTAPLLAEVTKRLAGTRYVIQAKTTLSDPEDLEESGASWRVATELPFLENGSGYVSGIRHRLYIYDSADGTATVGATRLSKGWITEIGSDVTMGDGEGLKEDMTESEMLAILTESGATVSATRSNGTATPPAALKLPVVWTGIVQSTEGGNTVWTAQGYAEVVGLGIATTVARTPVHKTLDVEQMCAVTVASGIENGTVTVSAAKAFVGEEIIITVTPAEGYEIGRVTVNGSAITDDDGVYKMTVSGDMSVSAEFTQKTQGGDNKPDDNDPDNNPGGNDGPNGATDAGCGCGAFVGTTTALSLGALLLLGAILFAVARRSTKRNR